MHSDDAPAYPSEGRNADYDQVDMNMGDVDMMDDNADEMMPEEFDEITAPNWREEVSEFHMNKMYLLTSLFSSASPDDIDTCCTFFHGYDIPDSNESVIGRLDVCTINQDVLQRMHWDP